VDGNATTCGYPGVDEDAPICSTTSVDIGPPIVVEFTIQDTGSGLATIDVDSVNADVSISSFGAGTTAAVVVTATQADVNQDFSLTLEAYDLEGNSSVCGYSADAAIDEDTPTCERSSVDLGPPLVVEFTVQDTGSGLSQINVLASNADVNISPYTPGTTSEVTVTVTRLESDVAFSVIVEPVDMAGNKSTCNYFASGSVETRPEFDAVAMDSDNVFIDYAKVMIIENGRDVMNRKINDFSDFVFYDGDVLNKEQSEYFETDTGAVFPDPCFSSLGTTYRSAFAPTWSEANLEWQIILQMEPSADVQLNLIGCVLRTGSNNVWRSAEQTGRYRLETGNQIILIPTANPTLTVRALPGPHATPGFPAEGFYLDARLNPGMAVMPLVDAIYCSEAIFEGGLFMVRPETGSSNAYGQSVFKLSKGDRIRVSMHIPFNNPVDLRYGSDSAVLKYIGILGTEYTTSN
jgi:hypothetical protein